MPPKHRDAAQYPNAVFAALICGDHIEDDRVQTLTQCRGDRTVTEVYVATGIPASTLSLIERGLLLPTREQVDALQAFYGGALYHVVVPVVVKEAT